mmetsp:Transcript_83445/g.193991  ORF Transcript_83445/g.193991 Transcript_83445/m.193991 type:complete len:318 (+) Transcript_83445:56-1009(+)
MGCAVSRRTPLATHAVCTVAPLKGDKEVVTAAPPSTVSPSASSSRDPSSEAECSRLEPALAPRPLTEDERQVAWQLANYFDASSDHESPIALWILGPSSVGKSTLTTELGCSFDIPMQHSGKDVGAHLDAVIIDGEFMREAHDVWRSWVRTDDWRSAYPALKLTINTEKDSLEDAAVARRKHLVIPQTMLNLSKGLSDVARLTSKGYTNHVLAIVAPLEDCRRRGLAREVKTGKRYQPLEFERSISAIPAMVSASNGCYKLIRAIEENDTLNQHLGHRVLAVGQCGNSCKAEDPNIPTPNFSAGDLTDVLVNNIGVA